MKGSLTIAMLSLIAISCNTPQQTEEKPLMDQVMEVHDAVMPKMGELMKTKKALIAKAESLSNVDSLQIEKLKALAEEIDLANEAMMDWMHNFDPNFEASEDEVKDYLTKKRQGIEKVAEAMNDKLEAGKKALE
ncbi:MAG: hypothetical protein ACJA08_000080 [Cyclobacteriaceae bacterium]|jgi:hypothetical protein